MSVHGTPYLLPSLKVGGPIGRGLRPLVQVVNRLCHILNNTQFVAGGQSWLTQDGLLMEPDGLPWGKFVFGYTRTPPDVVTIKNIEVQWGANGYFDLADQNVTLPAAADDYYIGVEFNGTALTIPAADTDRDTFKSDSTTYRQWLYQFTRSATDAITLTKAKPFNVGDLNAILG